MSLTRWEDLVEVANSAKSVDDLHRLCGLICQNYEYDYFIYGAQFPVSLVRPQILILSGYPDAWRQHYTASGYIEIDPTVHYCRNNIVPIDWTHLTVDSDNDVDAVARNFMSEARTFGLKSGASFPVHGSRGELAMLSMACSQDHAKTRHSIAQSMPFAQLLASYVHEAVRRVFEDEDIIVGPVELTDREKEALLWAAEGKSADEIGRILNISQRTVVFHLQNTTRKLGVTNRRQAVARAVSLGIIRPAFSGKLLVSNS